jgi:hypothetical protein
MTDLERHQLAITAALLDQGRHVHHASLVISAIALLTAALLAEPSVLFGIVFLLLFALELYLAIRVAFDARLFVMLTNDLALGAHFDPAMRALNLLPESKVGRDWITRCGGARRLFHAQALVLAAQCATVAVLFWIVG